MTLDPFLALGIVIVVIIGLCITGIIVYKFISGTIKRESKTSMPLGSDSTTTAKMLQDKYRSERDSGEFKRNI